MAYIPFIYFTLIIIYLWYKTHHLSVGLGLFILVDIASFFSILIDIYDLYGDWGCNDYSLTLGGVITYCLLWTVLLYPLLKLDSNISFTIAKPQLYIIFCWILVCSIIVYLLSTPWLENVRQMMTLSGSDAYDVSQAKKYEVRESSGQFWLWIPMVFANAWPLTLWCWFFNQLFFPKKRVLNILLLVLSLSSIIQGLVGGGRGAALWWVITFVIYFIIFRSQLSGVIKKKIYIVFLSLGLILIILFSFITISRFGNSSTTENVAWYSIVGYAGQMLNNFNIALEQGNIFHVFPNRVFPLYNLLVNGHIYINSDYYDILESIYYLQANVFMTLFGNLLLDVGLVGLLLFMFIYLFIANKLIRDNNSIDFSQCILLVVLLCIPIRGLFGWPFAGHISSMYILLSIGLYVVFKYTFKIK